MKKIILFLTLLIMLNSVNAATIGVSRAEINFDNVLKGGYAEQIFTASTDSQKDVSLQYEFLGEIADWLSIESDDNLKVKLDNPETLKLIVEPPINIANGNYEGVLRITTGEIGKSEGQFGSIIRSAFRIKVTVIITGRQEQQCTIGGVRISSAEKNQDLELSSTIKNSGNVNIKPTYEIDFWNAEQTKLIKTIRVQSENNIKPTQTNNDYQLINNDLELGQYFADIKITQCNGIQESTFQVLEQGAIDDQGELIRISNNPWAKTNDIVSVSGDFVNKGERSVDVKLKGTISLNGKIIKIIDTEKLRVAPGETTKLETYFNPTTPGQYLIKLRALYNNKLTFEKESLVNVNPSGEAQQLTKFNISWYPIIIFILAIISITLLLLIKKNKSRTKRY